MTKAERAIADTPEAEVLKEAIFVVVRAFDVKEIVNLWARKLRGSEVNAGQVLE
jgi:hypothetical protein